MQVNYIELIKNVKGTFVPKPLSGTLSGHSAGEPFDKHVYGEIKKQLPNNTFRQYEYLNDLYSKNAEIIGVKARQELFDSPSVLFLLSRGKEATKKWSLENPFDENLDAEDWDINLRLARRNYQFGFVNKKLFNYRVLANSLSNNYEKMEKSYFQITDKYIDDINKNPKAKKIYNLKLIDFQINKFNQNTYSIDNQKSLLKIYQKRNFIKYNLPKKLFKNLILHFRYLFKKL